MPKSDPPRKKRQFHRPEKTVEVCYRGDLVAEIEDRERELRDLRTNSQTMSDVGRTRAVAERIEALREQMRADTEVWRLRGRNRGEWAKLVTDHPPRKGNQSDEHLGYNLDTFFPALIRACLVEPDLDGEEFDELVEQMSAGRFDELADAALAVSRRKVDVPFSFAASATLSSSGETSEPQPE